MRLWKGTGHFANGQKYQGADCYVLHVQSRRHEAGAREHFLEKRILNEQRQCRTPLHDHVCIEWDPTEVRPNKEKQLKKKPLSPKNDAHHE